VTVQHTDPLGTNGNTQAGWSLQSGAGRQHGSGFVAVLTTSAGPMHTSGVQIGLGIGSQQFAQLLGLMAQRRHSHISIVHVETEWPNTGDPSRLVMAMPGTGCASNRPNHNIRTRRSVHATT
jgi:hypothetical protein